MKQKRRQKQMAPPDPVGLFFSVQLFSACIPECSFPEFSLSQHSSSVSLKGRRSGGFLRLLPK